MVSCKTHKKSKNKSSKHSNITYSIMYRDKEYYLLKRVNDTPTIMSCAPLQPIYIENPMNVKIKVGYDYYYLKMCDTMFCRFILIPDMASVQINSTVAVKWFTKHHEHNQQNNFIYTN